MIKKAFLALAIAGAMTTAQAGVVVTEGFEDVGSLTSNGWVFTNASSPAGSNANSWYQGSIGFDAQSGTEKSYIASNYNSGVEGGVVDTWLITPEFSTLYGATVSFWLRGGDEGYVDQIAYGFSSGSAAVTSFILGQTIVAPTGAWTQFTASIGPSAGVARFAIEYLGAWEAVNYVGVDSLTIDVPEPASLAILAAGLIGMSAARRRKQN